MRIMLLFPLFVLLFSCERDTTLDEALDVVPVSKNVLVQNCQPIGVSGGNLLRRCVFDEAICYIFSHQGISCVPRGMEP